ncbi:MAG: endonuclease/exonuclease/phosphatase family protein [Rhizobiaceae bacterium]|nr:endonuclease/exonuclease/phosphatase family protein [Rhizobiaceae bacterium]
MRILSLNAWGGKLYQPLIDYLAEVDADVYCLQEVVRTPGYPGSELIYRDGDLRLPQRTNLFDDICAALPEHDGRFFPAARGLLFNEAGDEFGSEFGLATFVRHSLSVIAEAMDFVHGAFSGDGWGAHPRPRNAHCIRLYDAGQGASITLAHMHGLREPAGKHDSPLRERQAERLHNLIARVWPGNERLVVCGDFNVLPDSTTFEILGQLGLADLVTGRGFTDTRTSHYEKPGRYADYMLVNDDVEVVAFDVVAKPEVSDHRALLLHVR